MPTIKHFAVGQCKDGLLEIMAIAGRADGDPQFADTIWLNKQLTSSDNEFADFAGNWLSMGGFSTPLPGIAMTSDLDGYLAVALSAGDNVMYSRQGSADGLWAEWESLGDPLNGAGGPHHPAGLGRNQDGRMEVFIPSGYSPEVWYRSQKQPEGYDWNEWRSLGFPSGEGAVGAQPPTVARNKDGRLEVYLALGTDIWHTWQSRANHDQWVPWRSLGSPAAGAEVGWPTVIPDRQGRLQLFASSGPAVWSRRQHAPGQAWDEWTMLPAEPGDGGEPKLAAGAQDDGRLVVFALRDKPNGKQSLQKLEQAADGHWTSEDSINPASDLLGRPIIGAADNPALVVDNLGRLRLICSLRTRAGAALALGLFALVQVEQGGSEWEETLQNIDPP